MSTIVASTNILWAEGANPPSPMIVSELLATQGFATLEEHITFPGMETSFFWPRPGRGRAGIAQAGNSMNTQVMGSKKLNYCLLVIHA